MNTINEYGVKDRFTAEAARYPQWTLARVIAQHKGRYTLATEQGECPAEVSGKFRYQAATPSQYPVVGDYVMVTQPAHGGQAIIHQVLTRASTFQRTAVGVMGQSQIVAVNIDIAFLCMSLNHNFNLSRLERYLAIAWDSGATPVILLTKSDLCEDLEEKIRAVEGVAALTDVVVTSALDEEACSKVLDYVKPGVTASFLGSSGVGKSTLINRLMGEAVMATSEVGRLDKGRHTTTGREMLVLPNGGVVIDTPGMREIGVESVDLSKAFADIEELEATCKFSDCTHKKEPGCAVQQALADGRIDQRRLDSYFKLKREAKYDGLTSKKLEQTKLDGMFGAAGGMKGARKYLRQSDKRSKG